MNYKLHIINYKLKEMKTDNVIVDKSKSFALKVIAFHLKAA